MTFKLSLGLPNPSSARVLGAGLLLAILGCACHPSRNGHLSNARAATDAIDTLLRQLGSNELSARVADSVELAMRQIMLTADTSQSLTTMRKTATPSTLMLGRLASKLRSDGLEQAAAEAAARSHLNSLRRSLDSLPEGDGGSDPSEIISSLAAWPVVIAVLLCLLFLFPGRLASVLGPIRSIRLFNSEVVLSERTAVAAEETFERLRSQSTKRFKHLTTKAGLDQLFVDFMKLEIKPLLDPVLKSDASLRSTLYVPDILFSKHLTQLVDYWPSGGGRGRAFTIYFGMIGKAWRLGRSDIQGNIPTNPDDLILNWGMTYEEALARGKDRQSFAAIVLKDGSKQVGILYMDCKTVNAFGTGNPASEATTFEETVLGRCYHSGLVTAISRLNEEIRADASPIDLQQ